VTAVAADDEDAKIEEADDRDAGDENEVVVEDADDDEDAEGEPDVEMQDANGDEDEDAPGSDDEEIRYE